MDRLERLREIFSGVREDRRDVIEPLLHDVAFLEERLRELRGLPMMRVHPKNPARQEVTPAGKQYKEFMQAYLNAVKVLEKVLGVDVSEGESPLMRMLKEFEDDAL